MESGCFQFGVRRKKDDSDRWIVFFKQIGSCRKRFRSPKSLSSVAGDGSARKGQEVFVDPVAMKFSLFTRTCAHLTEIIIEGEEHLGSG